MQDMYIVIQSIVPTIAYVVGGFLFWYNVSWTVASAMLVGGVIHNGDYNSLKKSFIAILWFIVLITTTNISRLHGLVSINSKIQALAGTTTIILIAIAYLVGLFLGVTILKYHHKYDKYWPSFSKRLPLEIK